MARAASVSNSVTATGTSTDLALAEPCPGINTVIRGLDALHNALFDQHNALFRQGDMTQQNTQKILEQQKQMNDRLILIQSKTEAILTQNYELLEYPFPRLFIVLPETSTPWDPATMLRTQFRLHFISLHEGYLIDKPTKFFKKYGPFLIVMLEMIRSGTSIASGFIPGAPAVDRGIEYSLKYLEEIRAQAKTSDGIDVDSDAKALQQDLASYIAGVEGLNGPELRQLRSLGVHKE
ncbi:hypothetical protein BGZ67_008411 [Mortierella alpina]|nr:hypothetical protein BGZ67_008411 [Mortierella alpina]